MPTLTEITAVETAWSDRYAVMDQTRDFIYNKPFVLTNSYGKEVKGAINVTLPLAAIFCNSVVSDLMDSIKQVVISGDISSKQIRQSENFLSDVDDQLDEQLLAGDWQATQNEIFSSHITVRSFIGMQICFYLEGGVLKLKGNPIDMRWCPHLKSGTELLWVAPKYFRQADDVNREYEKDIKSKGLAWFTGGNVEVRDVWDKTTNQVWVVNGSDAAETFGGMGSPTSQGVLVREQRNPYGYVPFVLGAPARGFMLRDSGYLAHQSEDTLFLVKDLYQHMNRLATIEATKSMETIDPAYLRIEKDPDGQPPKPPPTNGQIEKISTDEDIRPMVKPDLNNAFMTARADFQKVLSDASYTSIDLGTVTQQVSSIWITTQSGIRKKFSAASLKALSNFKAQVARMEIEQYMMAAERGDTAGFNVGGTGHRRIYQLGQFGDPSLYSIKYEYRSQDALLEIANLAQFGVAIQTQKLPLRWSLEHILKVSDPDGIMAELELDNARATDPTIALSERVLRLIEEADDEPDEDEATSIYLDAKQTAMRVVDMIIASQQPQPPPPIQQQGQPSGNGNATAALAKLAGGIGG